MITVVDNFCPQLAHVRESVLAAGFGTWRPNKGKIGSSVYEGMGFWGAHSHLIASVSMALETPIYPNSMFFRYTTPAMEKAYIHSDRETGAFTCVAYLSEHPEGYGTAFYRHIATNRTEMPPFTELDKYPQLEHDMTHATGFEQIQFVPGKLNRAVIFSAPLFHSRIPLEGIGDAPEDARLVWVSHFHTPQSLLDCENGNQIS